MLEPAHGLSASALRAIAELEREVVAADGGRLKLEWGTLGARSGERVEDLLWWDGGRLVGFVGLYAFGRSVELAGMVAPDVRRQGIGSALLDAALELCREHGHPRPLLVVPRPSTGGRCLALRYGGALDHSEHALVLTGQPPEAPAESGVQLRPAVPADTLVVSALLAAAFGDAPDGLEVAASTAERTLLVEVAGSPVGTIRITRHGDEAGIYGFAVDPAWQGRGIGREVLRQVCGQVRGEGVRRVGLEVAVDNERALGLYTSVGFAPLTTEDYYALPLP